jgi:hypothetical protein
VYQGGVSWFLLVLILSSCWHCAVVFKIFYGWLVQWGGGGGGSSLSWGLDNENFLAIALIAGVWGRAY